MNLKKGKKINGVKGWFRFLLLIFLLVVFVVFIITNPHITWKSPILDLIFIYFLLGTFLPILTNRYFVRKLTFSEIVHLMDAKLVHYTDYLSDDEILEWEKTGFIKLHANGSARSNYSMRFKNKHKKYVWFHQSNVFYPNEPKISSFISSHLTEGNPRKYKILIEPFLIEKERFLIRPWDKAIVIKGDYIGLANIESKFKWPGENISLSRMFYEIGKDIHCSLLFAFHQYIGNFMDWYQILKNLKWKVLKGSKVKRY